MTSCKVIAMETQDWIKQTPSNWGFSDLHTKHVVCMLWLFGGQTGAFGISKNSQVYMSTLWLKLKKRKWSFISSVGIVSLSNGLK